MQDKSIKLKGFLDSIQIDPHMNTDAFSVALTFRFAHMTPEQIDQLKQLYSFDSSVPACPCDIEIKQDQLCLKK